MSNRNEYLMDMDVQIPGRIAAKACGAIMEDTVKIYVVIKVYV